MPDRALEGAPGEPMLGPRARELAQRALDEAARRGARFAEVRLEAVEERRVAPSGIEVVPSRGLSVRAFFDGGWGFAAVGELDLHDVGVAACRAAELARGSAVAGEGRPLASRPAPRGRFPGPSAASGEEPEGAAVQASLQRLADRLRAEGAAEVHLAHLAHRRAQLYLSSDEGETEQIWRWVGLDLRMTLEGEEGPLRCTPRGLGTRWWSEGDEGLEAPDELFGPWIRRAAELARARPISPERGDLILDAGAMARLLAALVPPLVEGPEGARRSAPSPARRVGPAGLTLAADPRIPRGVGSFELDDEGVSGRRELLVEQGLLQRFFVGRDRARDLGSAATLGSSRAGSWFEPPAPTVGNLVMEAGEGPALSGLVRGLERGILVEGLRRISLDPRGGSFVAEAEGGWRIEQGRLTEPIRDLLFRGAVTSFLDAMDEVGGGSAASLFGLRRRIRGRSPPFLGVSAPPASFRGVDLGAGSGPLPPLDGDRLPFVPLPFERRP